MRIRITGTTDDITHAKVRLVDPAARMGSRTDRCIGHRHQRIRPDQRRPQVDRPTGTHRPDPVHPLDRPGRIRHRRLAVSDIADRISKRRRAEQFLEHTRELSVQGITITLLSRSGTPEITTLTADHTARRNTDE